MRDDDFEHRLAAGSQSVADSVRPRPAAAIRARGEQRRRRQAGASVLAAAVLVAGGGAIYAGIRSAQAPAPASPAASHRPGPQGTRPAPGLSPSGSAPPASSPPATSAPASSAPATGSAVQIGKFLPRGPYADAVNAMPHYTVWVSYAGAAAFQGSVTFVAQDGQSQVYGTYRATLLSGGRLTFVISTGLTLTGSYRASGFTLDKCGTALQWASTPALCRFSYSPAATS